MLVIFAALISSSTSIGHHFSARFRLRHLQAISSSVNSHSAPMATAEESLRKALAEKQSAVEAQGNAVRAMKVAGASKPEIDAAIDALNGLKLEKTSIEKQLQAAISGAAGDGSLNREAFRQAVVNTLERRLFYIPSFKIYRGVAGLYDYGPPGCSVKSNVLAFWRQVRSLYLFWCPVLLVRSLNV